MFAEHASTRHRSPSAFSLISMLALSSLFTVFPAPLIPNLSTQRGAMAGIGVIVVLSASGDVGSHRVYTESTRTVTISNIIIKH